MIRVVDSPCGELTLVASDVGIVQVCLPGEPVAADEWGGSPAMLDTAERQLDEYFAGRRHNFDVPLDRRLSSSFAYDVQDVMLGVGYGETISYGDVARRLGRPAASRAVGSACGANPIPIIIPCHRIVRSDGSLGGYRGGADLKRMLLQLESDVGPFPS